MTRMTRITGPPNSAQVLLGKSYVWNCVKKRALWYQSRKLYRIMTLFEDQKVKIILDHHFFYYWFIFRDHQSSNKYYLSSKNMCCFSSKMMGTIIEQSSTNHYPKSWNINKNSSPVSSIIEKSPPISSLKKKNKIIKKTSTSRQKNINYQKHIKGSSKNLLMNVYWYCFYLLIIGPMIFWLVFSKQHLGIHSLWLKKFDQKCTISQSHYENIME